MTRQDFLTALTEASKTLQVYRDTQILRLYSQPTSAAEDTFCYCPITAVCKIKTGHTFRSFQYSEAARLLDIDYNTADVIAAAADDRMWYNEHIAEWRKDLRQAMGI